MNSRAPAGWNWRCASWPSAPRWSGRIASSFHGGGATGLPPEHEHALLRIAQEAVINAARHGAAAQHRDPPEQQRR